MAKRKGFGSTMFQKDPDVLPFFSIHPKTKVGSILRVCMTVFCLITLFLMFLANKGIMFLWFQKYSHLVYIIPAGIALALLAVALYKRMKTTFTRIAVPGMIVFFGFVILSTFASVMGYTADFSLSPKLMLQNDDKIVVLMRSCVEPDTVTVEENGVVSEKFVTSIDAYRYTVRVPEAREGVSYTIEGEIYIPISDQIEYEVKEEWVDDNTFRLYIAKDTSETGRGEIFVRFAPGETTPASEEATSSMVYRKEFVKGENRVYFYRENTKMQLYVDSPYMMSESDMKQLFVAYPRTAYMFANLNTRVEGVITLEPNGELGGFTWEWNDDRTVARLMPTENSKGASGSIVIYFEDDGIPSASWGEATPVDATIAEATMAEAGE